LHVLKRNLLDRRFQASALKVRRIVAHHVLPLSLRHQELAHPEVFADCHRVCRALHIIPWRAVGAASPPVIGSDH
jgi:hypothetical protein